jgi:cellulose synthase/poly-beta-1,6-N-acetylglucosamine synthase-like glycosyltransferase
MNAEELPKISICMPIYNRNNFKPLILNNLLGLDYPRDKLEFCIDDDGTEPFFYNNQEQEILKKLIHPIKLNYYYRKHKRTIGAKRNNLVKIASHKIIACMDSDDIYFPEWLYYAVNEMKNNNYSCVGSNQMIFLYPHHNWTCHAIRCASKRQIHEACMLFTKKHWSSMGGFKSTSQGEGSKMADFNEKNVGLLEINKCMACICHNDNTINKDMFMKEDNEIPGNVSEECKNMVNKILNISP